MATTSSGTSTGLNVNGISKMNKALDNYQAAVIKKCNIAASSKKIEAAIKGSSSEKTLAKMYNTIDVRMRDYVTQLDQYNTFLNNLKNEYEANDANNTTFSDVTKSLGE